MTSEPNVGQRLLVTLIDEYARQKPDRVWVSVPNDNSDLTKGFRDITFKAFANAINHAARWLTDNLRVEGVVRETVAYAGPKDLRYPIIAVAALKCEKQLLLCSPFATATAQKHLLKSTSCYTYMHTAELGPQVRNVVGAGAEVSLLEVPELHLWLSDEVAEPVPYTKTWEEAQWDPWLIFHTSGTTGMPKPIVYTNRMMASADAAELMPPTDGESVNDLIRNKRYYVSIPSLHFVGMKTLLQWTVYLNAVLITGPPGAVNAGQVVEILKYGKVEGAVLPPTQIEEISRTPEGLSTLRSLDAMFFAGAPLPRYIAEKLVDHCKVCPGMGSTEAGTYFLKFRNDGQDWEYYSFHPAMGIQFEKQTDKFYELVFQRQPHLERWQQLFNIYPELDVFHTKDLWTPHPSRQDLWRFSGRTDDLIIFGHGEDLHATEMEAIIQRHPDVKTALIGGQGRPKPFLLLDLVEGTTLSRQSTETKIAEIWPYVEQANEQCSDYVKLTKRLVIFTDPARPFPLTAKHTVVRQPALALYEQEIDQIYSQ